MPTLADFRRPKCPFRRVSLVPQVQELYEESRYNGTGHQLAELFAFKKFPGLKTDTEWLAGQDKSIHDGMHPLVRERLLSQAKAAGVATDRAIYKSQLARFPGDPEAWVEGRDDVKRVAERRGMKLEGGIEYTPPGYDDIGPSETGSRDEYQVAPDLVNEHFRKAVAADPKEAKRPGFKQELANKLAGHE